LVKILKYIVSLDVGGGVLACQHAIGFAQGPKGPGPHPLLLVPAVLEE